MARPSAARRGARAGRDSAHARPRQIGGFDCPKGVALPFAKRFIGAKNWPARLSEFDVQQSFCLSAGDIAAVAERFRHDHRVAAAIQMLFLRASGRPMDRFASSPKTRLRAVCEAFQTSAVSIASLRSL